jgi:hypothetical protein
MKFSGRDVCIGIIWLINGSVWRTNKFMEQRLLRTTEEILSCYGTVLTKPRLSSSQLTALITWGRCTNGLPTSQWLCLPQMVRSGLEVCTWRRGSCVGTARSIGGNLSQLRARSISGSWTPRCEQWRVVLSMWMRRIPRAHVAVLKNEVYNSTVQATLHRSKHIGNYMLHLISQSVTLHFAHRVYSCVSYDSQIKQRLFFNKI